jgi:hypothetical protein
MKDKPRNFGCPENMPLEILVMPGAVSPPTMDHGMRSV